LSDIAAKSSEKPTRNLQEIRHPGRQFFKTFRPGTK